MSIHVALNHRTVYRFDRPVRLSPHLVRLRPAPHCRTPILGYSLKVEPKGHFLNWQQDPFSNHLARLVFPERTTALTVEVDVVAEMAVYNPFDFFLEPAAEQAPFVYEPGLAADLAPYLRKDAPGPRLAAWLASVDLTPRRTIDFLVELNRRLQAEIRYIIRMEPGVQAPEETLERAAGSCRDTGWLLVQALRHLGFAARFVSGYLIQLVPDVKSLDGPSGATSDFTDLHAWCEVYLPGAGWVGLDPTSGLLAGEGHLPLACTPEPQTAAAITGALDPCEVEFEFDMKVTRVRESPRVTKPYTEEQWSAIEALGHRVDKDLKAGDVRLTMGGEPTFVSIDDMDGAEWNTAAVGPRKRELSMTLVKRLQQRFAPGGFLHFGQGKWYPGEQLPRYAFGCYWRKDGAPIWLDPALTADERVNYGVTHRDSERFVRRLCERIGLTDRWVLPAYEDVLYYIWKERRLPVNVDVLKSELRDEMERARLARVFEQGLDRVVGHVLPIQKEAAGWGPRWGTGPWFFRPGTLFLLPGDSPIGFRLPLDSLPHLADLEYPHIHEQDPLDPRPPLPPRPGGERQPRVPTGSLGAALDAALAGGAGPGGRRGQKLPPLTEAEARAREVAGPSEASPVTRTAVCVEPRQGRLYVFLPPVRLLEHYLELVAAVEDTADDLNLPVLVEGYPPPNDPRLNVIKVTPDPGVIEVNIHPAADWGELVDHTTGLYEEARQTRLGAEKFMLDGRHTGTGGGNHVVLGGAVPSDSPFLRRPDLLRSLVAYWNNHPSLSYLFSGLFIGPTSQSPRVDEARHDALYELEKAFREVDRTAAATVPPWLVDRLFRNLLVDVSGNTHRSEFCIDKLYSPDGSSGRLGLLEMRALEMPPHARMSLTQQLLIRALVAEFWKRPYEARLVRWGTQLHDRFLLPHWSWEDFRDVVRDLNDAGHPFEEAWFAPHFEFRFPFVGAIDRRGLHVEIRNALEPWPVLGEEGAPGGTVRYVDSSVERLQVRVAGMTESRHVVTCNGRRVPLHPTGTVGEQVAGVRFRAWQPPQALHPTIGVHTPLVFDVVDLWSQRSIGGCTYHVVHPGGRSYSTFPVNAYEAESRRLSRFQPFGHTTGRMDVPAAAAEGEFPMTLDLLA